jgi:hypothetical protein
MDSMQRFHDCMPGPIAYLKEFGTDSDVLLRL